MVSNKKGFSFRRALFTFYVASALVSGITLAQFIIRAGLIGYSKEEKKLLADIDKKISETESDVWFNNVSAKRKTEMEIYNLGMNLELARHKLRTMEEKGSMKSVDYRKALKKCQEGIEDSINNSRTLKAINKKIVSDSVKLDSLGLISRFEESRIHNKLLQKTILGQTFHLIGKFNDSKIFNIKPKPAPVKKFKTPAARRK